MPAPPLSNTFEGGTDATDITTGNSGGASGDALSNVTAAAGAIQFSSTQARGTLSGKFAMAATAVATHFRWTGFGSLTASTYFRWYLYKTATPAGTWFDMIRFVDSAVARAGTLSISTSDKLRPLNAAGTSVGVASTTAIPNNQWVRIEARFLPSTTAGEIEWRLYVTDPDAAAGAFDETANVTGLVLSANIDGGQWGLVSTPTNMNGQTWYYDNLAVSSVDWIGPAGAPSTVTMTPTFQAIPFTGGIA